MYLVVGVPLPIFKRGPRFYWLGADKSRYDTVELGGRNHSAKQRAEGEDVVEFRFRGRR